MHGKAHMLMGVATQAPMVLVTDHALTLAGCAALAVAGSIAPDLDHHRSSTAHRALRVFGRPLSRLLRAASRSARRVTGTAKDKRAWSWCRSRGIDPDHRALTHTAASAVLAGVATGALSVSIGWTVLAGVAVFAGWMSHLLSDACTKAGVPLAWPLSIQGRRWYRVRLMHLTSCGRFDWWVAWAWSALCVVPTVLAL